MNQGLDQTRLGLGQAFSVGGVDGDIAQRSCAIVLDVDIGRRKKMNKNGNGTGVDELLSVVICVFWSAVASCLCHQAAYQNGSC